MELMAILLASVLSLVSPAGLLIDRVAENVIRSQFKTVEQLQVRVDNAPVHQILQGRVNRILISGRGFFVIPEVRIDTVEIESDPIDLDPASLQRGQLKINQPIQTGLRLILRQEDINKALASPAIANNLRNLAITLPGTAQARDLQRFSFLDPQVRFLEGDRLQFQVDLQQEGFQDRLKIVAESGLRIIEGRRAELVNPLLSVDNQAAPVEILTSIAEGISDNFDLAKLQESGVTARILKLQVKPDQTIELAIFVRVSPEGLALLARQPGILGQVLGLPASQ